MNISLCSMVTPGPMSAEEGSPVRSELLSGLGLTGGPRTKTDHTNTLVIWIFKSQHVRGREM